MEFLSAQQISPDNLQIVDYDVFILAAGYEQRSVYLPKNFNIKAQMKLALAFQEKSKKLHRQDNDSFLLDKGFKLISLSGEQCFDLEPYFSELYNKNSSDHLYVLVDYSSMTKVWYSSILNYFLSNAKSNDYVTVHFSYTPALYNDFKNNGPVKFTNLVSFPGKKLSDSLKPIALLIGLGLDHYSADYIWKFFKPAITFLLYADPTNDVLYVEKVFKLNQNLIEQTEVRNLVNYPLNNLKKTDEIITNLCLELRAKYNVVFAPMGPKVLTLIVLLMASRYPDITVLRVGSGPNSATFDRVPFSKPLIYSVEFVSDELDL